jgi:N-acetylmuramoyl-L-alanine amidase
MTNNLRNFTVLVLVIITVGFCVIPIEGFGQTPAKVLKVMIDPGHGGEDAGSKGSGGVTEKDLTLALANKLAQALEAADQISPELLRTDDQSIPLDQRAGLANHDQGDLLISLHLGTTFAAVPKGFTIYYWSPTTASPPTAPPSTTARPWDQEQEPYWEKSRMLGSLMQEELLWSIPWASGGVLPADIYLLSRVRMPAVMLELGSLNHPDEAAQLQKPEFQEAVAKAITQAIIKYRSLDEKGLLLPQPQPQSQSK